MEVMNPPGQRRGSSATTIVLLFLALATAFLFDGSHGRSASEPAGSGPASVFHRELTRNHMTVAQNLSPEHGFLGFQRLTRNDDGDLAYGQAYNRFPVFGYALIRLATLPFPNDFYAREAAARTLMLMLFAAAAVLAHLALCRLTGSRWSALAATLLAFSSYYALYHRDMVATEGMVDLFGTMLVLHGIAVFATDGRFGQLLAKMCAALLLGWHVYALLLPFVLLGLAAALRGRDWKGFRRHLTLGAVALAFGALVLATNFAREHMALGGETTLMELPSVQSMLVRTGVAVRQAEEDSVWAARRTAPPEFVTAWPVLAAVQLKRIAWSMPYAVGHFVGVGRPMADRPAMRMVAVLGGIGLSALIVAAICVLLLSPAVRHRVPLAALALTGPCWAFAVSNQHYHTFEGLFDVGVPLAFFALALPSLERLLGGRVGFSVLAGVAAVPTFALSSFLMARATVADPEENSSKRAWAAEVDAIREQVEEGKTILVSRRLDGCSPGNAPRWKYYFAGYAMVTFSTRRFADFVVTGQRIEGARTLTPDNRFLFLYDRASHDAVLSRYERHAERAAPVLDSSDYDLHLVGALGRGARGGHPSQDGGGAQGGGNELLFFRDQCTNRPNDHPRLVQMGSGRLFVHVWPADANDLPAARRQFGFDAPVDFERDLLGWRKDNKCYAVCGLPDYRIARVRVGSVAEDGTSKGVIWEGGLSPVPTGGEANAGTQAPRALVEQSEEEARAL